MKVDDHDHDGHHGPRPRLVVAPGRRAAGDAEVGHSRDTANQVDESLETSREGRRALLISLVMLAVTAALQAFVVTSCQDPWPCSATPSTTSPTL